MKFVMYGPHYDDNTGGIIVLYKLCQLLNDLNHEAKVWHWTRYHPHESRVINGKFSNYFNYMQPIKLEDDPHHFTYQPASLEDIDDSIVIYPEIIEGNPLGAKRVVRWLLYKPGARPGTSCAFGVDELTFFYSEKYLPNGWAADPQRKLTISDWKTHTYTRTNLGNREGVCYMVRKGVDLPLDYHPVDAMRVDDISHADLSAVFNRCKQFISYDAFSAYSTYAALCGCDSIVVPRPELSLEDWRKSYPYGDGVAYGLDDVERARQTWPQMVSAIENAEVENRAMAINFVSVCESYFSDPR